MRNLTEALASIYPENVIDNNKVSGLDVLKPCTTQDDQHLKLYGMSCKQEGTLYVTNKYG